MSEKTTDIVTRLRSGQEPCGTNSCRVMDARSGCLCAAAADEIEKLRKRYEFWRNACAESDAHAQAAEAKIEQLGAEIENMKDYIDRFLTGDADE